MKIDYSNIPLIEVTYISESELTHDEFMVYIEYCLYKLRQAE